MSLVTLGLSQRFSLVLFGIYLSFAASSSASTHFEPSDTTFVTVGGGVAARIGRDRVAIASLNDQNDKGITVIGWRASEIATLAGEQTTGGQTNYYTSPDPAQWRIGVPHFRSVRVTAPFPGIDLVFRFSDDTLEFDANIDAHANPGDLSFQVPDSAFLTANGDLRAGSGGPILKKPVAWQTVNGVRQDIDCSFRLRTAANQKELRFHLGQYNPALPLTIDPVVEYATYIGGDGDDSVWAIAADSGGRAIVAGTSTSINFPGASFASRVAFTYVTRLSGDASAVEYTTVLGSGQTVNGGDSVLHVAGLRTAADGSVYLAGFTDQTATFPVTPGAWNTTAVGSAGYAVKLDSAGQLVYSTYLGNPGWTVSPKSFRVRNGVAYIAGTLWSAGFLGTAGAYQRDLKGDSDFYAIALTAAGNAPLFATAIGGSGSETLTDMDVDSAGNVMLCGYTSSTDFPVTPDALATTNSAQAGVIARLSADGSSLLSGSYFGTNVASMANAGSNTIIGGYPNLPSDLAGQGIHHTIALPESNSQGYVAELAWAPLRIVWNTSIPFSGWNLQTDAAGHIYFLNNNTWRSGGAAAYFGEPVIDKLAPDGSRLEFIGGLATFTGFLAVRPDGEALTGGAVFSGLQTTPGVLQPSAPAKSEGAYTKAPLFTGFAVAWDTSAFTGDNFFVQSAAATLKWRIGEPPPPATTVPLSFNTAPFPLTLSSSNPALSASVTPDNSSLTFGLATSASLPPGTTSETVTVASAAEPAKSLSVPVTLTVQPQVYFTLEKTQVDIPIRYGQTFTSPKVEVTENFGSEYFNLTAVSNQPSWLYVGVFPDYNSPHHDQISINVAALQPGTYDGVITVSMAGLTNGSQTINVHYVVSPAATIQVSSTALTLHIVKGQPVTPVSIDVTGSTTGVSFSFFFGMSRTWLQAKQIGTTTPGSIQFSADSSAAELGLYYFTFSVNGEAGQSIQCNLTVDVSSGAPLDVTPSSVNYTWTRGGQNAPLPQLSVTSASPATVTWHGDPPWIIAGGLSHTPVNIGVSFDTTMPEGVYQGNLIVTSGATNITVPITYSLYDAPYLVFPTTPLVFNYQIGSPPPPAQTVQLTSPTLKPAYFNAGINNFPSFASVTPRNGSTPATLSVSVDPTGLAPGTYSDKLGIAAAYPYASPETDIPITLNITADPNSSPAAIAAVSDAASYLGGSVAPGEIMVLFGSQMGPSTLLSAQPDSSGRFPFALSGSSVYFDDIAAPLIYVSQGQVAAVAPFAIAGKSKTVVKVVVDGKPGSSLTVNVVAASPSVFTADASGSGPAAALLYPAAGGGGTLNNSANPASAGDVIALYASGLGAMSPTVADGTVLAAPLPTLAASVRVTIGGQDAKVLYAGPAPALIAGMTQINVQVPANLPPGPAQVLVIANNNPSQPGVTVALH